MTKHNWQEHIDNFKTIAVETGGHKVSWEYIGEGFGGDYNDEDPNDTPLLRFYCFKNIGGNWDEMTDGSYCTHFDISTQRYYLMIAALIIIEILEKEKSPKHLLEKSSWFNTEDFEKRFKPSYNWR